MTAADIDAYLDALDEPRRGTLAEVRRRILAIVPDAEEGLSYGAPVFRVNGRPVAGIAAFRRHLTYAPHSGTVTSTLAEELAGYRVSKGSFQFPVDEPVPEPLLRRLIEVRLAELAGGG